MIENMADGDGKIMAQKEMAMAQDSMLSGKMGYGCLRHASQQGHSRGYGEVNSQVLTRRAGRVRPALSFCPTVQGAFASWEAK